MQSQVPGISHLFSELMDAGPQSLSFLYPGPAGLAACEHSLLPAIPGNEKKRKSRKKGRACDDTDISVLLVINKTGSW